MLRPFVATALRDRRSLRNVQPIPEGWPLFREHSPAAPVIAAMLTEQRPPLRSSRTAPAGTHSAVRQDSRNRRHPWSPPACSATLLPPQDAPSAPASVAPRRMPRAESGTPTCRSKPKLTFVPRSVAALLRAAAILPKRRQTRSARRRRVPSSARLQASPQLPPELVQIASTGRCR